MTGGGVLWLTVFDHRMGISWPFPGFGADSYCGGASFMEDQAIEVIGQIGQGEFRLRSGQADGSDEEVIAVLLVRKDVLNPCPDC